MSYLTRQIGSFYSISGDLLEAERLVDKLNPPERRIVAWFAEGKSLRQIAEMLGVTEPQAEALKASVLRKLGMRTTADLVHVGACAALL